MKQKWFQLIKSSFRDLRIGENKKQSRETQLISDSRHEVDASGLNGDEGRRRPRKSAVSCLTSVDPHVPEWRNPAGVKTCHPYMSKVV